MARRNAGNHVTRNIVLGAIALGVTALLVQRSARQAEIRHPPRGRFITVDGIRLHYFDEGAGPPVVLLHGNGAMASDFVASGVLDMLARDHRVIAFDRPGFGYSDRPRGRVMSAGEQATLLTRAFLLLGISRPVVAAHSWAALTALSMALDHAMQVQGLVLVGGYYYPTPRAEAVVLGTPAIPLLGDVMRYTVSPLFSRLILGPLLRKMFRPREISAAFLREVPAGLMLRPSQLKARAEESILMMLDATELSARYDSVRQPVVILAGEDDRIVNTRHQAVRLHEAIPNSELRLLPGVGHMFHHAAPDEVVAAIRRISRAPLGDTRGLAHEIARRSAAPLPV